MTTVEPLRALNLDASQQKAFISYYRTLPSKPSTTIRFFNRTEYFTVHDKDAKFAAQELFKTTCALKTMGNDDPKLDYLCLSKANFEKFVRDLLLVKQYRAEVYVNQGSNKNNDWVIEYKGSPGNLSQFEEILFENNDDISNSVVMAIKLGKNRIVGMSCVDANERLFSVCEFTDNEYFSMVESLVVQISPKECLIQDGGSEESQMLKKILERSGILCTTHKKIEFTDDNICQDLDRLLHFEEGQQEDSRCLPEINMRDSMSSLHVAIKYLELITDDFNFSKFKIKVLDSNRYVHLDSAAVKALNILPKPRSTQNKYCSLLGLLDSCRTAQGHRLILQWIKQPLRDINSLNDRLDLVEVLFNDNALRHMLFNDHLRRIPDLLMLSKKILRKKAGLQDCYRIFQTIEKLPHVVAALSAAQNSTMNAIFVEPLNEFLGDMEKFQQLLETTLDMDLVDKGEFLVKASFDDELTELYKQKQILEEKIQSQLRVAARDLGLETGKIIKLESTEQLGYFFRVTLREEPVLRKNENYNIIGAIKGGVRFTTKKLESLNEKYNDIKTAYEQQQKSVVTEIISIAAGYADTLNSINYIIAQLDVLVSFAQTSASAPKPYIRPTLLKEGTGFTKLIQVRHPCLEMQDGVSYNPNDIEFKQNEYTMHIITGPNMGGKSTYIRSIGVAVLLAHIGCFVPCDEAEISLVDCILARVGSDDCQAKGLSTFMLEMVETAGLLRVITKNSLVIIDELGRGTSTYEGCGIAWAIAESLAKDVKAFSMFATHFHEITRLSDEIATIMNKHVTAIIDKENNGLTLLYQVKPGVCDESFGIYVAKMAGFSSEFVEYATNVQHNLEDYRNLKVFQNMETHKRKKMLQEGDIHIKKVYDKCLNLDLEQVSDEELQNVVKKFKADLLTINNPYIHALLTE